MSHSDISVADILPQKPPFVFVDRILDYKPGISLTAIKKISFNDPYLVKRHDGKVVFPQTFVIEAAAQAAILFTKLTQGEDADPGLFVLGKIESRILADVFAGDALELKVISARMMSGGGYVDIEACVEGNPCAEIRVFYSYLAYGAVVS